MCAEKNVFPSDNLILTELQMIANPWVGYYGDFGKKTANQALLLFSNALGVT